MHQNFSYLEATYVNEKTPNTFIEIHSHDGRYSDIEFKIFNLQLINVIYEANLYACGLLLCQTYHNNISNN